MTRTTTWLLALAGLTGGEAPTPRTAPAPDGPTFTLSLSGVEPDDPGALRAWAYTSDHLPDAPVRVDEAGRCSVTLPAPIPASASGWTVLLVGDPRGTVFGHALIESTAGGEVAVELAATGSLAVEVEADEVPTLEVEAVAGPPGTRFYRWRTDRRRFLPPGECDVRAWSRHGLPASARVRVEGGAVTPVALALRPGRGVRDVEVLVRTELGAELPSIMIVTLT